MELLATAGQFASVAVQKVKYTLAGKRPIEFSPQVQPMILTPTHGTLPSGHATEAFLLARLLVKLQRAAKTPQYQDPVWAEMLMRQAARVAVNRTVAGVHFPADSAAGALMGLTLADFIAERCDPGVRTRSHGRFLGGNFDGAQDFDWHMLYDAAEDSQPRHSGERHHPWARVGRAKAPRGAEGSAVLAWLWDKAVAEWADLPGHGAGG